jgi:hypothetical protein
MDVHDAETGIWLLTVEGTANSAVPRRCEILGEVKGTRQDALASLWEEALQYVPSERMRVRRRRVYRAGDGYVVRYDGLMGEYVYVFQACEQVWDSESDEPRR